MSTKPNRQSDEVVPIKYSGGDQFGPRQPLPAVGIVWCVRDGNGPRRIVIDSTPLGKAELYGDFLTYPQGHYEVWESWRRLGPAGLARRGLPTIIAWHEYENFPPGRVVFDTCSRRFTVYADCAPLAGRGSKQGSQISINGTGPSPPSRGRGSKRQPIASDRAGARRPPRGGVDRNPLTKVPTDVEFEVAPPRGSVDRNCC